MVQSEAQKRAKAKYYAKLREDPQYREDMARRQKEYYDKNKEKHLDTVKKYYQANKDKIYGLVGEFNSKLVSFYSEIQQKFELLKRCLPQEFFKIMDDNERLVKSTVEENKSLKL